MTDDELDELIEKSAELGLVNAEAVTAVNELMAIVQALHQAGCLRCERTGNPCGTDTWPRGWVCGCLCCQAWGLANLPPEVMFGSRILDPDREGQ